VNIVFALVVSVSAFAFSLQQAAADEYPSRTVRVIEPYSPGGAPDVLLRLVAQKLSEKWNQAVIIENRPGGNTLIGTTAATKSEPDGYTLLLTGDQTFILNPLLYAKLPYSMNELEPIILLASIPNILVAANKVPVANVKELIALAKTKPNTLMYGSTGPASIQRLSAEYFAGLANISLVHVPYKGAPETTTAILSGEIDMTVTGMSNVLAHIRSKRLKALAIGTEQRNPLVPDVPTMQEAGVPGYISKGSFGLLAPAGIPAAIKQKIADDVSEILTRPDVVEALGKLSFTVSNAGTADFRAMITTETQKWGGVVRRLNIKIE
jgi:tripartite-type tricarboxylate transporter receptor subunit TctC